MSTKYRSFLESLILLLKAVATITMKPVEHQGWWMVIEGQEEGLVNLVEKLKEACQTSQDYTDVIRVLTYFGMKINNVASNNRICPSSYESIAHLALNLRDDMQLERKGIATSRRDHKVVSYDEAWEDELPTVPKVNKPKRTDIVEFSPVRKTVKQEVVDITTLINPVVAITEIAKPVVNIMDMLNPVVVIELP